ncbi:hypothetical protein ACFS07_10880 [Undibacterium arcticum]
MPDLQILQKGKTGGCRSLDSFAVFGASELLYTSAAGHGVPVSFFAQFCDIAGPDIGDCLNGCLGELGCPYCD